MAKKITVVVPPTILVMMTGVARALQAKNNDICLIYTDYTAEILRKVEQINIATNDFCTVVSYVQSKRPNTQMVTCPQDKISPAEF